MTVRDPSIQTTSRTWLAYIALVALLTALCFSGVADLGLDTHDDDTFRDHERIARDFSFFFSPEKDQPTGRPTIELVKYLAYLAWGNDPAVFHLLVVFFHALASLLLARTAHHLGASLGLSMVGGLLFLVNVAHFQAVYWISALDYPVALICNLGAVTCYVDYDRGAAPARLRLYAFHAILVLGVLAHPSVVAAWLFCLHWAWRQSTPFKEIARRLLPFAALLLPTALLALHLSPRSASIWSLVDIPITESMTVLLGMLRMLLWLVSRLLTTAHWLPLPVYKLQTWELILGAVVLAGLVYPIWKKRDPQAHWAMWTLLSFPPFLLLTETTILGLPAGPSRYLYLASAGSSLLIAAALDWVRRTVHAYAFTISLLLILASSYFSLNQVKAISLYTSGRSYSASGQYATAREQFHRALAQAPEALPTEDVYIRLCLLTMHSEDDPVPVLEKALATHPASKNLRLLQLAIGAMLPSAEFSEKAMQLALDLRYTTTSDAEIVAKALDNLGTGFLKKKDLTTAIRAYEQTLRIDPDRFKTLKDLTFARWQRAAALIDEMETADRDHGAKQVAELRQQIHLALDNSRHALRLRPDADLYYAMGRIYQYQQRLGDALTAYEQTLRQDPAYRPAYQRMAEIFALQGDLAAADRILQALSEHTGTPTTRSER